MALFFLDAESKDSKGHQMHREGCSQMPARDKQVYVGSFATASAAFSVVPLIWSPVSYCPQCTGQ